MTVTLDQQQVINEHQNVFELAYLRNPSAKLILQGHQFDDINDLFRLFPDYFSKINQFYYHQFNHNIYHHLQINDYDSILSVGCLFGYDEKNIHNLNKEKNLRLYGIDISKTGIYVAQKNNPVAKYAVAIAEKLPFRDNSMDKIYSREVIEHVMKPEVMLKEIHRVLKNNGIAVITTPNADSFCSTHLMHKINHFLGTHIWENKHDFKDEHMGIAQMKKLLVGFKLEKIVFDGNFYFLLNSLDSEKIALFLAKFTEFISHLPLLNRMFCDQVKYIIRKKVNESMVNDSNPVEPETFNPLDNQFYCQASGQNYYDSQIKTANFINPNSSFDFSVIDPLEENDKMKYKNKHGMKSGKAIIWFTSLAIFYLICFLIVLPFSLSLALFEKK